MKDNPLKNQLMANESGVTLIELLIVLVISAIVIGGVYKVFIAQTRAYTIQDQVAEVQQDVRGAMEMMVRDLRMAGFRTTGYADASTVDANAINPADHSIAVCYEYISPSGATAPTTNIVTYALNGTSLTRTVSVNGVAQPTLSDLHLLDNVTSLNFGYGVDTTGTGIVSGINSNGVSVIPDGNFVKTASIGTSPILAVQVTLVAAPAPADPDVPIMVSPRKLTSVVTPRNVFIRNTTFNRYKVY